MVIATAAAVTVYDSHLRAERLDRIWERELFGGVEPAVRFPPRPANATALALERLAHRLGIDISTPHHPVPDPDPEKADRWQAAREPMRRRMHAVASSTGAALPPPEPELAAFLDEHPELLAATRDLLLEADPPLWELDVELAADTQIPNLIMQLDVHRLLLVAALEADRSGDGSQADRFLEAAWRLGEAAADHPAAIVQAIRLLQVRNALAVLRRSCGPAAHWDERLGGLTPRADVIRALQFEAWSFHQTFRPAIPADHGTAPEPGRPPHPLFWVDLGETLQHSVERLRRQDPATFDDRALYRETVDRIPPWGVIARALLPNLFQLWTRAVRTELVIEHGRALLAARRRLARGEPPRIGSTPSTAVPGLSWRREADATGVRIFLDGDLDAGEQVPVTLDFRVDLEACGAASS